MRLCKGSVQREKRRGPKSQPRGQREDIAGSGSSAASGAGRKSDGEMFENQEQRTLREGAVSTLEHVNIQVRRAQNSVRWIWPRDREVTADHEESRFSVSGVVGPRPGRHRWKNGRGKRKALRTPWVDSKAFLFLRRSSKFGSEWSRDTGQ